MRYPRDVSPDRNRSRRSTVFRILWRDGETDRDPDVYEFSRIVFGKNSTPMQAQFVAQEHARRHQAEYPLGAETVLQSTYMDDSLDSFEEDKKGIELYHQLTHCGRRQECMLGNGCRIQPREWQSIFSLACPLIAVPLSSRGTHRHLGHLGDLHKLHWVLIVVF